MHVLLIGSGGREHALAWMIGKSPLLKRLSVVGENPGFPKNVTTVSDDPVAFAVRESVDLVVVGPEAPLAEGLADRMMAEGIAVFGPTAAGRAVGEFQSICQGLYGASFDSDGQMVGP